MKCIEILTGLMVLFLLSQPAFAGGFAPPLPLAQVDASIAVIEIAKVVDPGTPGIDRPTVLQVRVRRLLRSFGNGLPAEFTLQRAPRIALGPADCSGQRPGLCYMNYELPKEGELQLVAANLVDDNIAVQCGPFQGWSEAAEKDVKAEIGRLSGVASHFAQEAIRLQQYEGKNNLADFRKECSDYDYSKIVAQSTDIVVASYENQKYDRAMIPAYKINVVRCLLDSGTAKAQAVSRPVYLYGEHIPVNDKYIVFLKANVAAHQWAPAAPPAHFSSETASALFDKLLFSYTPTSTNLVGVAYSPEIEDKIQREVDKLKRRPSTPDSTVQADFVRLAEGVAALKQAGATDEQTENNDLAIIELIKKRLPANNYVIQSPVSHLRWLYLERHDKANAIKYGNMLQDLRKTAPYIELGTGKWKDLSSKYAENFKARFS